VLIPVCGFKTYQAGNLRELLNLRQILAVGVAFFSLIGTYQAPLLISTANHRNYGIVRCLTDNRLIGTRSFPNIQVGRFCRNFSFGACGGGGVNV
jgi:hypothetical protein